MWLHYGRGIEAQGKIHLPLTEQRDLDSVAEDKAEIAPSLLDQDNACVRIVLPKVPSDPFCVFHANGSFF